MNSTRAAQLIWLSFACIVAGGSTGCITFTKHAVPASRLPQQFKAPSKCNLNPINFSMLGGNFPAQHLLGSGDVLAVTVQGLIPPDPKTLPPIIDSQASLSNLYYPPGGLIDAPSFGLPVHVQFDGTLQMPLVKPIDVQNLTLAEAAEKIRDTYVKSEIVKEGNDHVNVVLLRSRVNRIMVLREDASLESANMIRPGDAIQHKRGSAEVIDLPIYESDVLHAIAMSGGLPGVDAYNEVWILRKSLMQDVDQDALRERIKNGENPSEIISGMASHVDAIRIPMKLCPSEPIPFTQQDVILHDGDVVYIEPRRDEYFYTGGLLPGRQIPLPRDEDLDILEAIALAQGSIGAPGGGSTASIRTNGVGNVVPPSRALVLRKLPNGQQLPIRVDLTQAMKNPQERLKIMAGDFIFVHFKPGESFSNSALNVISFSYFIQ